MRVIKVPSGIGDSIWLFMKLINQQERFNFKLPAGKPQRGKQIFDLIPRISNSCIYDENVFTSDILANSNEDKKWADLIDDEFFLSCNNHLDTGNRIEDFLPDLKTSFHLPFDTINFKATAAALLPKQKRYIGIYTSSYRTQKAWSGWSANQWFKFIKLLGPDYTYVIIGADWDVDLESSLCGKLDREKITYIKLIGKELGLICEVMKLLYYFIAFPSGLPILNEVLGCRGTIMFYPHHLQPMIPAWASPERIESGWYKGCVFCEPIDLYKWLIQNDKL